MKMTNLRRFQKIERDGKIWRFRDSFLSPTLIKVEYGLKGDSYRFLRISSGLWYTFLEISLEDTF